MLPLRSVLVLATLFPAPAFSALSGFYDSAEKIDAILSSEAVADALRQAPVKSVENTGTTPDGQEEWTIRTQDCNLKVKVIALPPAEGMVGMTTYLAEPSSACD